MGEIAQRNGVRVSQLQSWNGLRSSRIGIGDQLIVGQKHVPVPEEEAEEPVEEESDTEEETADDGNIIADYLKQQMQKTEENPSEENPEEAGV